VGTALIFPSLTGVRERSADWRYFLVAPYGARALRARRLPALHCGVFHPGTVSSGPNRRLSSPWSGRLSPPFIRTVPAFFRRRPFVVRADGNPRRPGPAVRVHSGAGATPAPSTKTPLEDALTEQACRQYRVL